MGESKVSPAPTCAKTPARVVAKLLTECWSESLLMRAMGRLVPGIATYQALLRFDERDLLLVETIVSELGLALSRRSPDPASRAELAG